MTRSRGQIAFLFLLAMFAIVRPATGSEAESFSSGVLQELREDFLDQGDEDGFWREVQNLSDSGAYPIVEELNGVEDSSQDYIAVTFLHRVNGERPDNVILFANINHVLAEELLFEEIGRSGVYFKTVQVPRGVRFDYRIHENDPMTYIFAGAKYGTRMHLLGGDPDPLNPNKKVYPGGLGEGEDYTVTWLELPGASPQPYIVPQGNPEGNLISEQHESAMLGYSYSTVTFLPPGYDPAASYPFLIIFDGESYFSTGSLQTTLENLIADGSIPPLVALGVNAGVRDGQTQRNDEFTCNPRYMEFVNEELLPWFTSEYDVSSDPDQRVIAGASFGGLFAAYFAFNHPDVVSHVLSQSGSYHWGRSEDEIGYEWLVREFAFGEKRPISIYMEVGKLEGEYGWDSPGFPHQILSHRHFKTVLEMRGYDVSYIEYGGGHEMRSWRGGIAEGLAHIFESMESD